ncbi:MAG: DegT/DnrJ/EryC1/StrS aminotransferase [Microgenomates group bacterium GW2011_GWA2_44_7]|nr:MAG: DegT/DnrJ/EryC1/StrS aminotransferase [Microgenomates group bacterium GW2011_GWA2_44_7]
MKKRHIAIADLKISKKAKNYVLSVLNNNRLSYGKFTGKFEKEFAKTHNRDFAMVCNSGTSGLQVALHALKEVYGWEDNDEVLVPAVTFIASSNVIIHNNLKPVFVDVEKDYYCVDPKKIEEKITSRTRAIMPVHLFGQSSEMKLILKIAKKHNLKIIEDSCETMFVKYMGKPVGSLGDISVYSTYVAHIMVTGVGGIVTTNDELLATTIKSLMFHGRDNIYLKIEDDDTKNKVRLNSLIERRFQFNHVGYSYRLTEMETALGLAELEKKDQIIKRRIYVGKKLTEALSKYDRFLQLPKVRKNSEHIYMLYPIVLIDDRIEKEDLLLFLEENEVETRLFMPLLSQPIYKKIFGEIEDNYPIAKKLTERGFIIGSHPYLSDQDIKYVQNLFYTFFKNKKLIK